MANVTFKKVATGEFQVLNNGVATEYTIFNSSIGISGNGPNVYIVTGPSITGKNSFTLAQAKRLVAKRIAKEEDDDLDNWVPVSEEEAAEIKAKEAGIGFKRIK